VADEPVNDDERIKSYVAEILADERKLPKPDGQDDRPAPSASLRNLIRERAQIVGDDIYHRRPSFSRRATKRFAPSGTTGCPVDEHPAPLGAKGPASILYDPARPA